MSRKLSDTLMVILSTTSGCKQLLAQYDLLITYSVEETKLEPKYCNTAVFAKKDTQYTNIMLKTIKIKTNLSTGNNLAFDRFIRWSRAFYLILMIGIFISIKECARG